MIHHPWCEKVEEVLEAKSIASAEEGRGWKFTFMSRVCSEMIADKILLQG